MNQSNRPEPGDIYKHFKGNEYEIVCIAMDSETLEEKVIYRALYGAKKIWARPLSMFLEKVKHEEKEVDRFKKI